MWLSRAGGGAEVAVTIGTVLVFVVTGAIVLVAIVGGIWLETRMPDPHEQQTAGPARAAD